MNEENCKLIQLKVKDAGEFLKDKLPQSIHKIKRNSFAHIWERIKTKMGKSYKFCDDSQFEEIIELIEFLKNNPS